MILYAVLAAASSPAQDAATSVWSIDVSSPQEYVLCGRSMKVQFRASNAVGATLANFVPQWSSSDATVATVDPSGQVLGLQPGIVQVRAADPNTGTSGQVSLRVYPARIDVQPSTVDIHVGEQATLTARALDADGNPIPGVRLAWFSGVSAVASIDASGAVTGVAEGFVTVTAMLDIPGFDFGTEVTVKVRRRPEYRLRKMISSDAESGAVTLKAVGNAAYGTGDRIAFLGTLSNGSQGLMLYDSGRVRTIAVSGRYLDSVGRVINRFQQVAVGANGDVIASVSFPSEWCDTGLALFPLGQPAQLLAAGCGIGSADRVGDSGETSWVVWEGKQTLYSRRADGRIVRVAQGGDSIPGLGVLGNFGGVSISTAGNVIFEAYGANGGHGFFVWNGKDFQKIYANGDSILGRTPGYFTMPVEVAPGEYYGVVTGNFAQLVHISSGKVSSVAQNGDVLGGSTIWWIRNQFDARAGSIVFFADTSDGSWVYRTASGSLQRLAKFKGWWDIDQAFVSASGNVYARGTTNSNKYRLVQVSDGNASPLVEPGLVLDSTAPGALLWDNLVAGANSAGPVFRGAGDALSQVSGGSLQTVTASGDALPSGRTLGFLGGAAASRAGDIVFTAYASPTPGLYAWRGGRVQVVAEPNGAVKAPGGRDIAWFPTWQGNYLAMNNHGQVAAVTNIGGTTALLLYSDGATTAQNIALQLGPAPGGGLFQGFDRIAIDDSGRVAFISNQAIYLWDGAQVRKLYQVGDPGPNNSQLNGITNLQASADKFYARLNFSQSQEIQEYGPNGWRSIVSSGQPTSFGKTINSFYGPVLAVSSAGDVAYIAYFPDSTALVVRKNGRDTVIATTSDRTPDGEWLLGIFNASLTDQGDVFFTALTSSNGKDRVALYQATPQ